MPPPASQSAQRENLGDRTTPGQQIPDMMSYAQQLRTLQLVGRTKHSVFPASLRHWVICVIPIEAKPRALIDTHSPSSAAVPHRATVPIALDHDAAEGDSRIAPDDQDRADGIARYSMGGA